MIETKLKKPHPIKNQNLPLYLLSFLIMLCSCEFDPSDTEYTNLELPDAPEATLHLPFDKDTVYITGDTYVNFKFECPGHRIYKTSFTIDSEEIYSTSGESVIDNSVSFNYSIVREGTYTLSVTSQVESKSGSIADVLEAERFTYKKSWILVYRYSPEIPKITFVGVVDGQLKIMWDKSKAYNFDSYVINRRYEFHDNYIMQELITDPDEAYFIDTTYIAGKVTYEIGIREGQYTSTKNVFYKGDIPEFNVESNGNIECVFSWTKPECYKNFKSIKVTYSKLGYREETPLFEIDNLEQTSYIMKDGIFDERVYHLYFYPKDPGFGYYIVDKYYYDSPGEKFYYNTKLEVTSVPPYYIYGVDYSSEKPPYFFRYNTSTDELKHLNLGNGGHLSVSLNNQYIRCNNYSVNPTDFSYNFNSLFGNFGHQSPSDFSISNNGILTCADDHHLEYVDIQNGTFQREHVSSSLVTNASISPNGDYIVFTKRDNPSFEIWKYDANSAKYSFYYLQEGDYYGNNIVFKHSDEKSSFYIANDNNIELWSCENTKLMESHPSPAHNVRQIDPVTQNVICSDFEKIYIYKAGSFELIREIATDEIHNFVVVNSVIYMNEKKLDLKKYE